MLQVHHAQMDARPRQAAQTATPKARPGARQLSNRSFPNRRPIANDNLGNEADYAGSAAQESEDQPEFQRTITRGSGWWRREPAQQLRRDRSPAPGPTWSGRAPTDASSGTDAAPTGRSNRRSGRSGRTATEPAEPRGVRAPSASGRTTQEVQRRGGAVHRPAGLGQEHVVQAAQHSAAVQRHGSDSAVRRRHRAALPGPGVFHPALHAARAACWPGARGTMWMLPIFRRMSAAAGSSWRTTLATRPTQSSSTCRRGLHRAQPAARPQRP